MSQIRWPDPINEQGRLSEGAAMRARGASALSDGPPSCPQILHVSLFFDGTNNNMKADMHASPPTHTNVVRLFNACGDEHSLGEYAFYIPGVGTPFPEIGETEFSSLGKALALGFGMRVGWGYTRLLNALHQAMVGPPLLEDPDARALCSAMDDEVVVTNGTLVKAATKASDVPGLGLPAAVADGSAWYIRHKTDAILTRLHNELAMLQKKNSAPGGQLNCAIKKVHVNVFGFSRGAASARVFVNRLINRWAPGGMIAGAIPYEVNFLGLFDTVASVGIPDTATAVVDMSELDGHWMWTAHGALNVPTAVRRCVHFFSIHEQRMSFPLDTLREQNTYPGSPAHRIEVAYPGVHSDVGGGYPVSNQGKSRSSTDHGDGEGGKLSQIALHNMYIEALKAGVPLAVQTDKISLPVVVKADFAFSATLARAFNDWLSTVNAKPLASVEAALRVGMGQSLAWRTLRADIQDTPHYVTAQDFYKYAQEDPLTPYGMETQLASKTAASAQVAALKKEKADLQAKQAEMEAAAGSLSEAPLLAAGFYQQAAYYSEQIKVKDKQILEATAGPGKHSRPGEGVTDITTNDKTDLLEAAEEFRLLLAYLRPDQRARWQVDWAMPPADSVKVSEDAYVPPIPISQNAHAYYLTVKRQRVSTHGRQGSRTAWMGGRDRVLQLTVAAAPYQPVLDFVLTPPPQMLPFLLEYTSDEAVQQLSPAVVQLLDNYVHDSRAWFRVPYFHEYAPGGYGWARTFFTGNDSRVRYLGLPAGSAAVAAQRDAKETSDLGNFMAARSSTMQPMSAMSSARSST